MDEMPEVGCQLPDSKGVKLVAILGAQEQLPKACLGQGVWCGDGSNPPKKQMIFSLETACFGEF